MGRQFFFADQTYQASGCGNTAARAIQHKHFQIRIGFERVFKRCKVLEIDWAVKLGCVIL